ncbi:hypothetical protein BJP36_43160 [Moorena producens JHB]|uniref:Uncharacterized protein n=1 Tax=Moorena producens (strain JHB) TaxID=1454205 RepID=A0A9Q9ST46_MOOP1|nr:hypothetical protein [Moorena producens]WAN69161.1 hypothetical protein BJP36_43160 [Moorena producens JHB]
MGGTPFGRLHRFLITPKNPRISFLIFPVAHSRFPIPDSRFPIPDSRFPIPDSQKPCSQKPCSLFNTYS